MQICFSVTGIKKWKSLLPRFNILFLYAQKLSLKIMEKRIWLCKLYSFIFVIDKLLQTLTQRLQHKIGALCDIQFTLQVIWWDKFIKKIINNPSCVSISVAPQNKKTESKYKTTYSQESRVNCMSLFLTYQALNFNLHKLAAQVAL